MEIPVFNGEDDAYWWVLCMDKYFGAMKTPEDKKMTEAVTAMRGRAFSWWFRWSLRHPKASWGKFSWTLLWYFKPEFRDVLPIPNDEDWLDLKLDDGVISMKNMGVSYVPTEVITLTDFVTTETLEKNEEKPKDKENGGEEACIKGKELVVVCKPPPDASPPATTLPRRSPLPPPPPKFVQPLIAISHCGPPPKPQDSETVVTVTTQPKSSLQENTALLRTKRLKIRQQCSHY
jgi:hypothetical protein